MEILPPTAQVAHLLMGCMTSAAISAAARLRIPDHLHDAPRRVDELATLTGTRPDLLFRLLRAIESLGITCRRPDGRWEGNQLSNVLRVEAQPSLHHVAVFFADDWHGRALGVLDEAVRSGEPAFERLYGVPAFTFFENNPREASNFNRAMTAFSSGESAAILNAYDFSGIRTLTDVAGGEGLFLATLLERHRDLTATLFELPQLIAAGTDGPLAAHADRVQLIGGDMFETVPPGSDAYLMKRILHDWPDAACQKILTACRAGVTDNGRLLVIDSVVPPGNDFTPAKFMDLMMLLFSGGKERTEDEFRDLFATSGWRLARVIPTASTLCIVEGVPA